MMGKGRFTRSYSHILRGAADLCVTTTRSMLPWTPQAQADKLYTRLYNAIPNAPGIHHTALHCTLPPIHPSSTSLHFISPPHSLKLSTTPMPLNPAFALTLNHASYALSCNSTLACLPQAASHRKKLEGQRTLPRARSCSRDSS